MKLKALKVIYVGGKKVKAEENIVNRNLLGGKL